jgi:hypothetical protein
VIRSQYRPDHHNTETMFQTGECNIGSYEPGGPLKTIDLGRKAYDTTSLTNAVSSVRR